MSARCCFAIAVLAAIFNISDAEGRCFGRRGGRCCGRREVRVCPPATAHSGAAKQAGPRAGSDGHLKSLLALSPEELATLIRDDTNIRLATSHASGESDNAMARDNINQTAAGQEAQRSSYGTAPGGTTPLRASMLTGLSALSTAHGYRMSVSEIAGGEHSTNSRHYVGVAFDVNQINGQAVSANHPNLAAFKQHCRDLGATEVLGPGDAGHATHVHAAWPRP